MPTDTGKVLKIYLIARFKALGRQVSEVPSFWGFGVLGGFLASFAPEVRTPLLGLD